MGINVRTSYSRQTLLAELSPQPLGYSLWGGQILPSDSSCAMSFFSAPFVEKVVFALLSQISYSGLLEDIPSQSPHIPKCQLTCSPILAGKGPVARILGPHRQNPE